MSSVLVRKDLRERVGCHFNTRWRAESVGISIRTSTGAVYRRIVIHADQARCVKPQRADIENGTATGGITAAGAPHR